jgi:hypothetical protein
MEKESSRKKPHPSHVSGLCGQGMSKHLGAMRAKDEKMLPVAAFVEGELYLSWMHFFQAHSCLLFFIYFCSRAHQGTLPWCGDPW